MEFVLSSTLRWVLEIKLRFPGLGGKLLPTEPPLTPLFLYSSRLVVLLCHKDVTHYR